MGKNGLQLCDQAAGYGNAACPALTGNSTNDCYGAYSGWNYRYPSYIWVSDISGIKRICIISVKWHTRPNYNATN